jgi:hypothetical protein
MTLTGLYRADQDISIPLTAVTITVKVIDYSAKITIAQRYVNTEDVPLEVR